MNLRAASAFFALIAVLPRETPRMMTVKGKLNPTA